MKMASELSTELREYLKHCGLSIGKIARCNGSTRMYDDLDLYGDIAEGCMELLAKDYRVDLSGFEFEKFFPPEFVGKNMLTGFLLQVVPFAGKLARQGNEYLPLTLEMIDGAMRARKW
jgi:Protein of unknown function (DUF1493)